MKESCKRVCCHCTVVDSITLDKNEGRAHTATHRRAGTGRDGTGRHGDRNYIRPRGEYLEAD